MSEHADVEALSAYVDGEAPEWGGHVAACAQCRTTADELRAVAGAVAAAPVERPPAAERDRVISAALAGFGKPVPPEVPVHPRFARRRFENPWALAAVAAVVVAALGLSGLVLSGGRTADDTTTVAGRLNEESTPQADAFAADKGGTAGSGGAGGPATAAAPVPPTDLGDVPDAATLLARARPAATAGQARSSANSGSTAAAPEQRAAAPAPSVAGTRPCEEQARTRDPSLREVVFYATARRGQTPAVVLGFATGPSPAPVTLLLLAQQGCSELLRASAGP